MLNGIQGEIGDMVRTVCMYHHEWYDGTKSYWGKCAADLPDYVPIVSLCDVFAALIAKRPYKNPWPPEQVIKYIHNKAGTQFDPTLTEALITLMRCDERVPAIFYGNKNDHKNLIQIINKEYQKMDSNTTLGVRAFPIEEPKGKTLAFATVSIGDIAAIRSIRVIQGQDRPYVSMPKSKDKSGGYHDIACPIVGDLRKEINAAVLKEWESQSALAPEQRGYDAFEYNKDSLRKPGELLFNLNVNLVPNPKGSTLAYASVVLDDAVAINSIRVFKSENGLHVSMPQSKDKSGEYHDIAFPLSGDIRKAICADIITEYKQKSAEVGEKKQGIGEKLAAGAKKVADAVASTPAPAMSAAKKSPGIGE